MERSRLEAFSDAVMAIIITIMVIDLRLPREPTFWALRSRLSDLLTYALSFAYIGIYWSNHHHLIHTIKTISGSILWANLHLLFWLSLIPFAADWMGETRAAAAPTALYGAVLLMTALAYLLLQHAIMASHGADSVLKKSLGRNWKGKLSPVYYGIAIPIAMLSPWLANAIYAAVALLWLVPDRRIERALISERDQ